MQLYYTRTNSTVPPPSLPLVEIGGSAKGDRYYPTADQVYGEGVEVLVREEDTQALNEPIIAPVQQKKFTVQETDLPRVRFSREFMLDLMNYPEGIRNIAFAGHLHHGKTACCGSH